MAELQKEQNTIQNTDDLKPTKESKTFCKLLKSINRGLNECQRSIDTREAVEECYGDDASIFGEKDSATDMLANLISGSIERINEQVMKGVDDIFKKEQVETKLFTLDKTIEDYWTQKMEEKCTEDDDRQSVQDALQRSKLPDGVGVDDLLRLQAYKIKSEARDEIRAKLSTIEKENKAMQNEIEELKGKFQERLKCIDEKAKNLDGTANLCSFNGVI